MIFKTVLSTPCLPYIICHLSVCSCLRALSSYPATTYCSCFTRCLWTKHKRLFSRHDLRRQASDYEEYRKHMPRKRPMRHAKTCFTLGRRLIWVRLRKNTNNFVIRQFFHHSRHSRGNPYLAVGQIYGCDCVSGRSL